MTELQATRGRSSWQGLMVLALLWLTACAPAIAPQVRQQVDPLLTFDRLLADPGSHRGQVALVGGVIVQTRPKPGMTEIEVLQRPLDYWDEPVEGDRSGGRFLVRADGFHDPAIYRTERKITVAGEVLGSEVRKLGEVDYRYPILQAKAIKLWPQAPPKPPPGSWIIYPWGGPYFWGPWWGYPYWWP